VLTTSYHTHNRFCDGAGEIADYAAAAISAGLEAIGISSHAPLTFSDPNAMRAADLQAYCAEIDRVRHAHRGRLRVHRALEFDYIPERHDALWALVAPVAFDYLIGSVHFVGEDTDGAPWACDLTRDGFERGLRSLYGGGIRRLVGAYYERVRSLAAWGRVAIVGHFDRIKKWNRDERYFKEDEPWYRHEVETAVAAVARAGLIVELNTVGWRNAVGQPYPSPWILRRCLEAGIRLVVTTDAHAPERVTEYHPQAQAVLNDVGCRDLAVLRDGTWVMSPV
jgi:histidinol-phosphatase (PHP family)